MTTLHIGVMAWEKIRERTIAIAKGKYTPDVDEPKLWFSSMLSLSEVLSDDNHELLRLIAARQPHSIEELAGMTGCGSEILSKRIDTLERYNLINVENGVRPVALATHFIIHVS